MKDIVTKLTELGKTISTMESCTGGAIANAITNIEGASEVLKFSAVTYSNEFKIKMGVNPQVIEDYSVYSINTANEMSKKISEFTGSDYGIGVTGRINRVDKNNPGGKENAIYISIYDRNKQQFYTNEINAIAGTRAENKEYIIDNIITMLQKVLCI